MRARLNGKTKRRVARASNPPDFRHPGKSAGFQSDTGAHKTGGMDDTRTRGLLRDRQTRQLGPHQLFDKWTIFPAETGGQFEHACFIGLPAPGNSAGGAPAGNGPNMRGLRLSPTNHRPD